MSGENKYPNAYLESGFLLVIILIGYSWWPLVEVIIRRFDWSEQWWAQLDWLTAKFTKSRREKDAHIARIFKIAYWIVFPLFLLLMLAFVAPTFDKSFTILSLLLSAIIIFTPTDYRHATLIFTAGTGLGYFLELWGTTNHCWTYYTLQTPPLFAVLAHGLAAVAFWRAGLILKMVGKKARITKKSSSLQYMD